VQLLLFYARLLRVLIKLFITSFIVYCTQDSKAQSPSNNYANLHNLNEVSLHQICGCEFEIKQTTNHIVDMRLEKN